MGRLRNQAWKLWVANAGNGRCGAKPMIFDIAARAGGIAPTRFAIRPAGDVSLLIRLMLAKTRARKGTPCSLLRWASTSYLILAMSTPVGHSAAHALHST